MGKSVRKIPTFNEVMDDRKPKKIPSFAEVMGVAKPKPVEEFVFDDKVVPEVPPIDENDIISLSRKAEELSNKTIETPIVGGVGGGTIKSKDFEASKEGDRLRKLAKDKGYSTKEIVTEFEDFPDEAFEFTRKEDGIKPYSKENLLKLRSENPVEYSMKLNQIKNQFGVAESVKKNIYNELPSDDPYREYKADQAGIRAANEFNDLNIEPTDSMNDIYAKTKAKQDIISENISADKRDKALARVQQDASQFINGSYKPLVEEWRQSPFASTLDENQYAGLKTLELFDPAQYKQAVKLLGIKINPEYQKVPINIFSGSDTEFGSFTGNTVSEETEESINKRKGVETIQKRLADIGRQNAVKYIHRNQYNLDKAYKNANDEDKPLIAQEYIQYQELLDRLREDEAKDDERYPLLAEMKFDNLVKEVIQEPEMNAAEYGTAKAFKGFSETGGTLENILVNTFGSKEAKDELALERIGEQQSDESSYYLPEEFKKTGSPFIPKFSKELSDKIKSIYANDNLDWLQKKEQAREAMRQGIDQQDWVTNPDAGKSKSFFSKATVYGNAGLLGDISSIAAQSLGLGVGGASKLISASVPMFTTTQNNFYKEALANGHANPEAYANTHATIMAIAGMINPNLDIVKRSLGLNTQIGKYVAGIEESTWNNIVNKNKPILEKFKNSAISVGKEAAKMGAVYGVGTSIANDLADKYLGGEDISTDEMIDKAVEATKNLAQDSFALFGINALRNFKSTSTTEKANIWEAGTNPEITKLQIEDAIKIGEISPEVGKQRIDASSDIAKLIEQVPTENAKGKPLTDKQRNDFLYNLIVSDKAKELKKGTTESKEEEFDSITKQAESDNNKIISGYARKTHQELAKDEESNLSPEEMIVEKANEGKLSVYSDMVKADPKLAVEVLRDIAQQMYGITSEGKSLEGGGREGALSLQFSTDIIEAARKRFPTAESTLPKKSESLVSVIKPGQINQPKTITIAPKPKESEIIKEPVEVTQPSETSKEAAIPPEPVETAEGKGEEMRLAHADTEKIYQELNLPERLETPTKKNADLLVEADKMIAEGYDANTKAEKVMKGEPVDFQDKDQVAFAKIVAGLKEKQKGIDIKSPEFDKIQDQIEKLSRAADVAGTIGGRFLQSRKAFVPVEESLSDYVMREKEINKDAPLTEQQKETVQKEYNEITEAEKAYQQKIAGLEAENARLRAEKSLPKKSGQKTKKTHEDFVTERKEIFSSIKDKLKKARGESQATLVPYAKELIAISPDIAKLVKNLVEEGVTKLADIVKEVHGTLKDEIKGITEKDIHDLIAGEYSEKKQTRNEISAKLFDLRQEAKLINKLEELKKGVEPKTEEKKIKRNQEIEALRKQVKEQDITKLSEYKNRTKQQIEKLQKDLDSGNFAKEEKKEPLKLDAEAKRLQDNLVKLKNERQLRLLKQEYENSSKWNKIQTEAVNVLGVPRALMATGDFSAVLRQALLPTVSHPVIASKAATEMFKSALSKKNYDRWFFELENSERYPLIKESGLALTDTNTPKLDAKEEQFMNNLAQKIPLIGRLVKGSERAYSQYLNKMRVDLFNRFADQLQKEGRTFENSKEAYEQTANFVNNMTGRGDMGKTLNESAPILNQLFFSPRLMASRLNTLTYLAQPRFYKQVPKNVRKDYFRSLAATAGLGLTILGLAKLGGAETEDDPRSTEFGKIKVGNTRWDIWGGHQQYIRAASQIISGKKKTSSGNIVELGGKGPYDQSRGDVGGTLLRGKLAPVPSLAVDLMKGENIVGERVTGDWESGPKEVGIKKNIKTHLLPLLYTGLEEAMEDQGVKAIFTVGVPSAFGVGVNTYESTAPKGKSVKPPKPKKPPKPN